MFLSAVLLGLICSGRMPYLLEKEKEVFWDLMAMTSHHEDIDKSGISDIIVTLVLTVTRTKQPRGVTNDKPSNFEQLRKHQNPTRENKTRREGWISEFGST